VSATTEDNKEMPCSENCSVLLHICSYVVQWHAVCSVK